MTPTHDRRTHHQPNRVVFERLPSGCVNTTREGKRARLHELMAAMGRNDTDIAALLVKVFERHGSTGARDLHTIRPIGNAPLFRDGYRQYSGSSSGSIAMLYYEQQIAETGRWTSRAVSSKNNN